LCREHFVRIVIELTTLLMIEIIMLHRGFQ
jgi:hypothetical protein